MVANLAQLHHDVPRGALLGCLPPGLERHDPVVPNLTIELALGRGERTLDNHLHLGLQLRLDFLLEPPKQEGPKHLVKPVDQEQLLLLVHVYRVASCPHDVPGIEPLLEVGVVPEDVRQQEVEQGPQLVEIVLERRSRDEEPVARRNTLRQDLRELGLCVLHAVALIDDDVLPVDAGKEPLVAHHVLVRREQHVERPLLRVQLHLLALTLVALVYDLVHVGCPAVELDLPVAYH
mmetsp:Transcript_55100/g.134885  ORF Transcript_55100/g.134885 Transcript_55100/m.134885 type:complete len:234 (+) Transcript_55100:3425-4126(+)